MALLLVGCSAEQEAYDGGQQKGLMPVLFSAGNVNRALTRASASYMPAGSHFRCAMFFHAGSSDNNASPFYSKANPLDEDVNMAVANLEITDAYGQAAYQPESSTFYWQNRLEHVYLALADNHHQADVPQTQVGGDVSFDLTNSEYKSMTDQPDPIMALTKQAPAGATAEANRVNLYFKHLFAQVQVNVKGSQNESAQIESTQIVGVELLGVTPQATVTFGITSEGQNIAPTFVPTGEDAPFQMFDRNTVATGYLKSFECIAFGKLQGIRITWKESAVDDAIQHVTTFKGVKDLTLESGKKYIYNLELRRSLIAQVSASITPWGMDETNYSADGTITDY